MQRQRVAGPVGYDTAGLFDDGRHRQVIVWLQSGLDDQVDMPRRQQSVVVAVAAEPAQVYGPAKPLEYLHFGAFENVGRRRIQNGFVQRLCLAGAARLSRKSAVPAAGADPAFGSAGYVDDAQHGFAMVQQSKQRAPKRGARNETARAVYGIDGPDEFGIRMVQAVFFAQNAMVRKSRADGPAYGLFDGAVGNGHRAFIDFGVDGERMSEPVQGDFSYFCGGFLGEARHFFNSGGIFL